ncbi:MAG: DNA-binding protein [Eubacteriales bacterium]|nr:DNA-binding protein [Eubacteriales bacterium]
MEFRRFDDTLYVRMDKGEEIVETLTHLAKRENLRLAEISGIGATNDFTVGLYNLAEHEYHANTFEGDHEIVSLLGTLTIRHGEPYLHLHMSCAEGDGSVVGGHLTRAVVSATCEVVLRLSQGRVERRHDEDVGLNLFSFQ